MACRYALSEDMNEYKENEKWFHAVILLLAIAAQTVLVLYLQLHSINGGDGIFTFTMANSPYGYDYIDHSYKNFPVNEAGWLPGDFLRSSYMSDGWGPSRYAAIYFHQRINNHPLLYYSLVHTVCSLFPGTYRLEYALILNVFCMVGIDVLLVMICRKLTGSVIDGMVPILLTTLLPVVLSVYNLPRMYALLALMCLWFQYQQIGLVQRRHWSGRQLFLMGLCVFLGIQTHYYFFVYAGISGLLSVLKLLHGRRLWQAVTYVATGFMGAAASVILFPWTVWAIYYNQMDKHDSVEPWALPKLEAYLGFLNEKLCNGRGIAVLILLFVAAGIWFAAGRSERGRKALKVTGETGDSGWPRDQRDGLTWFILNCFAVSLLYSLVIFTLDGDVFYYQTGTYLPFAVGTGLLLSAGARRLCSRKGLPGIFRRSGTATALAAACVLLVWGTSGSLSYVREIRESWEQRRDFAFFPLTHQDADVIYVEGSQDNLFNGLLLQLGYYDEFKKIPLSEYEKSGITPEITEGRESGGDIYVYLAADEPAAAQDGSLELVETDGSFHLYRWNGGAH